MQQLCPPWMQQRIQRGVEESHNTGRRWQEERKRAYEADGGGFTLRHRQAHSEARGSDMPRRSLHSQWASRAGTGTGEELGIALVLEEFSAVNQGSLGDDSSTSTGEFEDTEESRRGTWSASYTEADASSGGPVSKTYSAPAESLDQPSSFTVGGTGSRLAQKLSAVDEEDETDETDEAGELATAAADSGGGGGGGRPAGPGGGRRRGPRISSGSNRMCTRTP